MATQLPVESFPPGEFIRDELKARGWTQADLAEIIGRPTSVVNRIIAGKTTVTARSAQELAGAFGTTPEFWLNLQVAYDLANGPPAADDVQRRARLYELAPIKDMEKRHWLKKTDTARELEAELRRFFGARDLENLPAIRLAARATATGSAEATASQKAWCFRVLHLARSVQARKFTARSLKTGRDRLRELALSSEGAREVPRVLAEAGIRLVVVEHLPKTRIDGAALSLGEGQPVIGLSLRFGRIDYFWHTLIHELSHIQHDDVQTIDTDMAVAGKGHSGSDDPQEDRADSEAANMLVPADKLDSFILRVSPLYSKQRIVRFARLNRIHPGIVVGQLQHRREIPYSANREMLTDVRDIVITSALTDGWGQIVNAE